MRVNRWIEAKTLAAGQAAIITLTATKATATGTISGTVAIYATRGRVARQELNISAEPAASPGGLNATPLVPSVSVELHGADRGPISVPVEGSNEAQATAVKNGEGTEAVTVGAVSGPGGPVPVTYNGESHPLTDSTSELDLKVDGNLEPGTYSGQVDLAPEEDEGGIVALEVKVSADWWWAALALVIGIVVGVFLLRASGRTLPRARLLGRVAGLTNRHARAVASLSGGDGGAKNWDRFRIKNLPALQDGLRELIEEATARRKVLVKIEESVLQSIEAAIAVVEAQIDLLKEIPKHARGVEDALQVPRSVQLPPLNDSEKEQGKPKLDIKAAEVIEGGPIDAEELKPRLEAMDTYAKQVRTLRRLENQLSDAWIRLQHPSGTATPERQSLEAKLIECRRKLWTIEDAEGLGEAAEGIQAAREELEDLAPAPSAPSMAVMEVQPVTETEGFGPVMFAMSTSDAAPPAAAPPPPPPVPVLPPPPVLTPDAAAGEVRKALYVQAFVVLVAAFVAVASGLGALYVGKTWGTNWDFLAALLWGIVAQATVTTLATSLDGLGALSWLRRS